MARTNHLLKPRLQFAACEVVQRIYYNLNDSLYIEAADKLVSGTWLVYLLSSRGMDTLLATLYACFKAKLTK